MLIAYSLIDLSAYGGQMTYTLISLKAWTSFTSNHKLLIRTYDEHWCQPWNIWKIFVNYCCDCLTFIGFKVKDFSKWRDSHWSANQNPITQKKILNPELIVPSRTDFKHFTIIPSLIMFSTVAAPPFKNDQSSFYCQHNHLGQILAVRV